MKRNALCIALLACIGALCACQRRADVAAGHEVRIELPKSVAFRAFDAEGRQVHAEAFAVGPRTLLTAQHAVAGFNGHSIRWGETWLPVEVAEQSEYADAAVLRVGRDVRFETWLRFADKSPDVGDEIEVAGKPGTVEGLGTLRMKGPISPGDSGSPVLDAKTGRVVGLLRAQVKDRIELATFTGVGDLKQLLKERP